MKAILKIQANSCYGFYLIYSWKSYPVIDYGIRLRICRGLNSDPGFRHFPWMSCAAITVWTSAVLLCHHYSVEVCSFVVLPLQCGRLQFCCATHSVESVRLQFCCATITVWTSAVMFCHHYSVNVCSFVVPPLQCGSLQFCCATISVWTFAVLLCHHYSVEVWSFVVLPLQCGCLQFCCATHSVESGRLQFCCATITVWTSPVLLCRHYSLCHIVVVTQENCTH